MLIRKASIMPRRSYKCPLYMNRLLRKAMSY
jgi:hypothetical protein